MKKNNIFAIVAAFALFGLSSCSHDRSMEGSYDPNDPGYEYAPEGDMYHSVPYDALTQYEEEDIRIIDGNSNPYNKDSMNMRLPAKGTVARGKMSYYFPYPNTPEGYNQAGTMAKNPIAPDNKNLAEGKRLYEAYCWQCHGKDETPKGSMVSAGKYPPPTWDFERKGLLTSLSDGKMFHSITYGRNLMGPHGPLLTPDQRWMIINYLKTIQGGTPTAGTPEASGSDTTNTTQPNTSN